MFQCLIIIKDENMRDELAGTTAICVLIKDKKLYCVSIHRTLVSHVDVCNIWCNL